MTPLVRCLATPTCDVAAGGQKRTVKHEIKAEVLRLKNTEKKLYKALKLLFELLELYSPPWYEKQVHDQAIAALKHAKRYRRQVRPESGRD